MPEWVQQKVENFCYKNLQIGVPCRQISSLQKHSSIFFFIITFLVWWLDSDRIHIKQSSVDVVHLVNQSYARKFFYQ